MKRRYHPVDIGVRTIAAVGGGYLLTLLSARRAAILLPFDGGEASIAASLGAWIVFLGVAIWAYAAQTAVRAIAPLIALTAILLAWPR